MRHWAFAAWIGAILGVTALQSELHLHVVLDDGRMGTMLDLDRSNGLPDLVSTLALASAAVGAALLSQREPHGRRPVPTRLAGFLAFLTLADVIHDGPHPVSPERSSSPWSSSPERSSRRWQSRQALAPG